MISRKKIVFVFVMLTISGSLSTYLQIRNHNDYESISLPLNLPMAAHGWQGSPFSAVLPREVKPGDFLLRTYTRDKGKEINLLALYSRISNYHPPALCYRGAGRQLTEIPFIASSSGKIRLAGLMGKRDADTILVYHGFYVGGVIIPDGIEKKIYEVREKLQRGSIHQYFFEITINSSDEDFGGSLSYIKRFLDDMEKYLIDPAD